MTNIFKIISLLFLTSSTVHAAQPKNWQLGFQDPASTGMGSIVWFHDYMLLPVTTAITVFVLFLISFSKSSFDISIFALNLPFT